MRRFTVIGEEFFAACGTQGVVVADLTTGRVTRALRSYWMRDLDPFYGAALEARPPQPDPESGRCIRALSVCAWHCQSGEPQLLVNGSQYPRFDTLNPPGELSNISPQDGEDLAPPADVLALCMAQGVFQGRDCVFAAAGYGLHIVDLISGKSVTQDTGKAFDLAWDEVLFGVDHGYGSGHVLYTYDPESARVLWESPNEFVEGGIAAWEGEVFLSRGHDIAVMGASSKKITRVLRVPGYRNGSVVPTSAGLWVMLGDFGGTENPEVKDGTELALIGFQDGAIIRRVSIRFPRWPLPSG